MIHEHMCGIPQQKSGTILSSAFRRQNLHRDTIHHMIQLTVERVQQELSYYLKYDFNKKCNFLLFYLSGIHSPTFKYWGGGGGRRKVSYIQVLQVCFSHSFSFPLTTSFTNFYHLTMWAHYRLLNLQVQQLVLFKTPQVNSC